MFPGWEFYAPVAGADRTVFDLLPDARVILDEPDALALELDKVWARIEEAHERSEIGNLVRPADLYINPADWREKTLALSGADLEYLALAQAAEEGRETRPEAAFLSQPATRFHGAIPAILFVEPNSDNHCLAVLRGTGALELSLPETGLRPQTRWIPNARG